MVRNQQTLIIAGLLSLFLLVAGCGSEPVATDPQESTAQGDQGTLVLGITDAPVAMDTISAVEVTVENLSVQHQEEGWIQLPVETNTFDLLALNRSDMEALLSKQALPNGTYNQIRFQVPSITVVDIQNESHAARIPSNQLRINHQMDINTNETTITTLDVLAGRSLRQTGTGTYIFTPVIHVASRNDSSVSVDENGRITHAGNPPVGEDTFGMNINGGMQRGGGIPENAAVTMRNGSITLRDVPGRGPPGEDESTGSDVTLPNSGRPERPGGNPAQE